MGAVSTSIGERRQITVMYSDLVGSTGLSAELDPEDLHAVLTQYHQTVTSIVKQYEGHLYQIQGDGVLVLFGYPVAQENDVERAVRAGLTILEKMKSLSQSIEVQYGKRLGVRVGIHTGEVMVRPDGGDSGTIFGETPNVASRVQSAAEPNTVCISAATQRLVAGFFVVDDLGPHILKGADPIRCIG
jgi:class 3 adenylate cyclase